MKNTVLFRALSKEEVAILDNTTKESAGSGA